MTAVDPKRTSLTIFLTNSASCLSLQSGQLYVDFGLRLHTNLVASSDIGRNVEVVRFWRNDWLHLTHLNRTITPVLCATNHYIKYKQRRIAPSDNLVVAIVKFLNVMGEVRAKKLTVHLCAEGTSQVSNGILALTKTLN